MNSLDQRPKLKRAARLRFDVQSQTFVLLSPERGLRLNNSATEIVRRCTGKLTVREIIVDLLAICVSEPALGATRMTLAQMTKDVVNMISALDRRSLLEFRPCAVEALTYEPFP